MTPRTTLNVLVIGVALCMAPMIGCGNNDDPSNNSSNNTSSTNNTTGGTNNTTGGTNNTTGGTNNPTGGECGEGEVKTSYEGVQKCYKTCQDATTCGEGNWQCVADGPNRSICIETVFESCTVNTNYTGELFKAGVELKSDASAYTDAGLDDYNALFTTITFPDDDASTEDVNECNNIVELDAGQQVTVTNAVVTSTSFSGRRITFQDTNGAALAFFTTDTQPKDGDGNPLTFTVGQRASFTITKVVRYGCNTPQISEVSDMVLTDSTDGVFVEERTGTEITKADWGKMVRVGGTITTAPAGCGGSNQCVTVEHGDGANKKTALLRTSSMFLTDANLGKCFTFVGPVSSFPGPLADGSVDIQLDSVNWDWAQLKTE